MWRDFSHAPIDYRLELQTWDVSADCGGESPSTQLAWGCLGRQLQSLCVSTCYMAKSWAIVVSSVDRLIDFFIFGIQAWNSHTRIQTWIIRPSILVIWQNPKTLCLSARHVHGPRRLASGLSNSGGSPEKVVQNHRSGLKLFRCVRRKSRHFEGNNGYEGVFHVWRGFSRTFISNCCG